MLVEVCANSLESAINAQKGGADRIELCSELGVGGITPSYGLLKAARGQISIPIHVLIRPRGGDFMYSESEFEIMKEDIAMCVELGFEGIVSGVLLDDFSLDEKRTGLLVNASGKLSFTFHRAFDWVQNPLETLDRLEALGVDTLLTSGQQRRALEGIELLSKLRQKANRCTVMPGSGISIQNAHIFKENRFEAIHLSGSKSYQNSIVGTRIPMSSSQILEDGKVLLTAEETVRAVVERVK